MLLTQVSVVGGASNLALVLQMRPPHMSGTEREGSVPARPGGSRGEGGPRVVFDLELSTLKLG